LNAAHYKYKEECGRQHLKDMLMVSVQHLPRIVLLFGEIKKHTDKSHEDQKYLQQTIDGLRGALEFLNEGKRQTEGQMRMFDILNEIEDCPSNLLSAQRQLIAEVDVSDLSAAFCKKKSSVLSFYLFNDCLEIAKKRQKTVNQERRSPKKKGSSAKSRQHKELVLLSRIRRIANVSGTDEALQLFALTIRDNLSDNDYTFSFLGSSGRRDSISSNSSIDMGSKKKEFLDKLCNYIIVATGRTEFHYEDHNVQSQDDGSSLTLSIRKAVKRLKAEDGGMKRTLSVRSVRQSGTFRRSVSQAMMQFASGTLRRVSRSNLRLPLQEIVEEAAANLSKSKNDSLSMIEN